MTNLKKQAFSAIAAGALVLNMAVPAAFAESLNLSVTGNGADSENTVKVETQKQTDVVQTNNANISNNISTKSSTGGNDANKNTGGDVKVDTGDAKTTVDVSNTTNSNQATVDCCNSGNTTVEVSGNGADSENKVYLDQNSKTNLYQTNEARVTNTVNSESKTGYNNADKNTGGKVEVATGKATTNVSVSTAANMNSATIGGDGDGGSLSAKILGNGADSYNKIDLDVANETLLTQANDALIVNDIEADAKTGGNDANKNTGGDVMIDTGDAKVDVAVDNLANFNAADVDCGCLLDVTAKIAGNGAESESKIEAGLDDTQTVFQDNVANLVTDTDADAKTGDNDANKNTGSVHGGDPKVATGNSTTEVTADNTANVNTLGDDAGHDMPEVEVDFDLSLSLSQLMALLGL